MEGNRSITLTVPIAVPQRMEMDLESHGTEIEYPRMALIDPGGLDDTLRVFRFERLNA